MWAVLIGFAGLGSLQGVAKAQQKSSFKVSGPCIACGAARIEGIVKGIDGVSGATYDAATAMLTVDFSPVAASMLDIQMELSMNGYDAGNIKHDARAKLPACAGGGMRGDQAAEMDEPGMDDIEGLEADTDWENPNTFELAGESSDDEIDIPEDEDDEGELTGWVGEDTDDLAPISDDEEEDDDDL